MSMTDVDSVIFDTLCQACIKVAEPIVRAALMQESEEFSREFPGEDYLLDEQEIKDHTHDASLMMTSALMEILHDTFSRMNERFLILSDDLMPLEQHIRPEFLHVFRQLAHSLSLSNDQASDIRRKLGNYLFAYYQGDSIPLPSHLCIIRNGDTLFLTSPFENMATTFRL